MDLDLPAGFRGDVQSGLIVPEALSRERQVWTEDEWRLLNRVTRLINQRGMTLILKCHLSACREAPIQRINQPGGFILRCAHADRVFTKAF